MWNLLFLDPMTNALLFLYNLLGSYVLAIFLLTAFIRIITYPLTVQQQRSAKRMQELGIKPGETTPDDRFSFELTNCIGACDKAPAMMINHDIHADLTPEKISEILAGYK